MPEKTVNEIDFHGVKFTEHIRPPNYSPGSDHGMLTWEGGPDMSIIQEPFGFKDPNTVVTLEEARKRIENLILYCQFPNVSK